MSKIFPLTLAIVIIAAILFVVDDGENFAEGINSDDMKINMGKVSSAELSGEEDALMKGMGVNRYFAFDIDYSDIDIDQFHFRVDYYQFGEKQPLTLGINTHVEDDTGQGRLLFSQVVIPGQEQEIWNLSFQGSSIKNMVTIPKTDSSMSWKGLERADFLIGKELVLAVVAINSDARTIEGISNDVFSDDQFIRDKALEKLHRNGHVYLLVIGN